MLRVAGQLVLLQWTTQSRHTRVEKRVPATSGRLRIVGYPLSAHHVLADEERAHSGGDKKGIVAHCPIGVVYSVQPWNFPIYAASQLQVLALDST